MTISHAEIAALEAKINNKLATSNAQFTMTVHFSIDRLNDERNKPPIQIRELEAIFEKVLNLHLQPMLALKDGDTFNIRCATSHINMPCGVKKVKKNNLGVFQENMVITVMRKKTFFSKDLHEFKV